jgi:NOL1/NOP2/sun family putative RNA methylase
MFKPFPDADKYEFKEKFIERYSKLTNWDEFKKYNLSFLRKSIRVNTLKTSIKDLKKSLEKNWILEPIPWCKVGFYMTHKEGRLDLGNTYEHALGYYYVQEAASMIPPIVLDPQPGEIILDMCAAPGSKSSQIAQYMNNEGLMLANDVKGDRLSALGMNLQRMGIHNHIITLMPGQRYADKNIKFDRVLLDAPCTGVGTIRKSPKTIRIWNPASVRRLASLQKHLILAAWKCLKPGGTLVYSTCSTEPEEDEAIIDYLLSKVDNAKVEEIKIPIKKGTPITEFEGKTYSKEVKKTLRLWPHENDTEGFFVAKLTKST